MAWLKVHWRWSALNLFALSVSTYVLTQGDTGWSDPDTFDPGLESGKWAIRFLLTSLMMTPLQTYFGWKSAIRLRKPAGMWAFGFAALHILLYVRAASWEWLASSMPFYLKLGLVGIIILGALAVTSNRWSMQRLGKSWKRLHRLVYIAGVAVVTHAILATRMSKKLLIRDPQAENELKIYLAVLAVLLVVRIPLIRQWLKQTPALLRRARKSISPATEADGAGLLPQIHGRESGVSVKPTFIIPNEAPDRAESGRSGSPFRRVNLPRSSADRRAGKVLPEERARGQ